MKLILYLFAILSMHWAYGQQRFQMGFNSGIILSQLDGDGYTGYDKVGFRWGIRSHAFMSPLLDLIIELNWEEKGSRFESTKSEHGTKKNQLVSLAYAEVPLILRINLKKPQNFFGELGMSISYLVSHRFHGYTDASLNRYQLVSDDFKRSEVNALIGGGYSFTPRFGLLFRTSIGVNYLYRNLAAVEIVRKLPPAERNNPEVPLVLLRNYLISVGAFYLL